MVRTDLTAEKTKTAPGTPPTLSRRGAAANAEADRREGCHRRPARDAWRPDRRARPATAAHAHNQRSLTPPVPPVPGEPITRASERPGPSRPAWPAGPQTRVSAGPGSG